VLGFSDSEPNQYNAAKAAQVTSAYPFTIIQGIPVTKSLRNALQVSQGLTSGDESEAGMPTLTAAQVNNIFAGRISTWSSIGVTLADNNVYKVRRSGGSGTTRAFDATFMGTFCKASGPTAFQANPATLLNPATQCIAGARYFQANTSDELASCLNQYDTTSIGAIGYLSTDFQPATADGYRWVKVDGFAPNVKNVADNRWKMWSELSVNYNTTNGGNQGATLPADTLAFYNILKTASSSQVVSGGFTLLGEVVDSLKQTTSGQWHGGIIGALSGNKNAAGWGQAATPALAIPRTDAALSSVPAMPLTRSLTTGYNLCTVPFSAAGYVAE
jgi:hypothetical protein